ncbi:helix-turn-helix transcriptional regulator [uncultured Corynebacterium sp.]|uniref:helix-turn-helix domain-containing protein n=1 Tax=uncultured Corynebacterium sp. TaxID=159447 RepID=UPI0025DD91B0|nr:helix-turn-helix transcriptional regulator [uncultured Corynebacterium sp.]
MLTREEILRDFGSRLRELRAERDVSQEQLAHTTGLDRTYISGIERGKRNVSLENIVKIADALDVPVSLFFLEKESANLTEGYSNFEYLVDHDFDLWAGFRVKGEDILNAILSSNRVLDALPQSLYSTVDFKSQSGIVGAVFISELAVLTGSIVNPIEKGHPDIVPASAIYASEEDLRNFEQGLEVKSTIGGVPKGIFKSAGEQRVDVLSGITWQAHHREVKELLALNWDFIGGTKTAPKKPAIAGAFYTEKLAEDDWGKISGTTGRNTKVTGLKVSGKRKLGEGAVVVINESRYIEGYKTKLGGVSLGHLS